MNADGNMIRLEKFSKSYGKVRAVDAIDLEVAHGESFALLGPNGGGKTSIIRAVVGLHAPTSGRILIDGFDVVEAPDRVKARLSYVPQRVTMPDLLTVYEILRVFARLKGVSDDRIDEVLDLFALTEVAGRPCHELSGGMLQRLGLAAALLDEVPLLVLDEPMVNLDPLGIELLQRLLSELHKRDTTIFFSSHLLHNAIQLADRVGVLVAGRMVSIEDVAAFRAAVTRGTTVRIVLSEATDGMLEAAEQAGAAVSECNGRQVCFTAPPQHRLAVIRAIEHAGGTVEEFHTETPDWEDLIRGHFDAAGDNTG
jgi:ABC-type multidrug transport system ATPase subunit